MSSFVQYALAGFSDAWSQVALKLEHDIQGTPIRIETTTMMENYQVYRARRDFSRRGYNFVARFAAGEQFTILENIDGDVRSPLDKAYEDFQAILDNCDIISRYTVVHIIKRYFRI
jgi:hypothetical protein